jgi:hypothetical protein
MKWISFFVVFFLGILLGYQLPSIEEQGKEINQPAQFDKKVFDDLAKKEMLLYAKAQDVESKLAAADILYNKMLKIFLADLALKINRVDYELSSPQLSVEKSTKGSSREGPSSSSGINTAPGTALTPLDLPKLSPHEEAIKQFKTLSFFKNDHPLIKKFKGNYSGKILYTVGKKKGLVDDIQIMIDYQLQGKKIDGQVSISMTDPSGFEYSRSNGSGANETLKIDPKDSERFFFESSPRTFLHLGWRGDQRLEGEFYELEKFQGKVTLVKQ